MIIDSVNLVLFFKATKQVESPCPNLVPISNKNSNIVIEGSFFSGNALPQKYFLFG